MSIKCSLIRLDRVQRTLFLKQDPIAIIHYQNAFENMLSKSINEGNDRKNICVYIYIYIYTKKKRNKKRKKTKEKKRHKMLLSVSMNDVGFLDGREHPSGSGRNRPVPAPEPPKNRPGTA